MTYNSELQSNNADLQAILDTVNALPDAGGGASVETCAVTFQPSAAVYPFKTYAFVMLENGELTIKSNLDATNSSGYISNTAVFDVVKNTLIYATAATGYACTADGDIAVCTYSGASSGTTFIVTGDGTIYGGSPCFVRGTLITLADGTVKPVEKVAYSDELLVWDFDNGCYATAKPAWIMQERTTDYYYRCDFDNGAVLKLVGSDGNCHRIFNADENMFTYATGNVGCETFTQDGAAKLVSCERIDERTTYYNIITEKHINLFAEGVLTSCRLNNMYPIEDMRFIKDDRELVPIEAYGDIDVELYDGLRLAEQKAADPEYVGRIVALAKKA